MNKSNFELLLPVGQKEMAEAAIHHGADAIYIGFPGFNARGRSYDFELEELKQIIELCHAYSVKVNLAFNIVIFQNELEKVIDAIKKVLPLRPDALIVQDLGLVKIIKKIAPEQIIHASTQMTITNDLAMDLVSDLGIRRYVLGRENSLTEIKLIAERTKQELEVFVHGALCVSYSGQCFTSETLGGRSANRGQCAQSCRFSYDLIVDGEKKELLDRNYLVSPQDLCGLAEVPELMNLGVKSFKVEGRLKSPDYVAQVASSYRKVIDRYLSKGPLDNKEILKEKSKMEIEYSRGYFSGWLHGVNHQELVKGTFSNHRGLEIGHIQKIEKNFVTIQTDSIDQLNIENGDGIVWFKNQDKMGGSIYSVRKTKSAWVVELSREIKIEQKWLGSTVYLNHDNSQKNQHARQINDRQFQKRIPVQINITAELNKPLRVQISDDRFIISKDSLSLLTKAQNKPLTVDLLFEEFASLGGTIFSLSRENFNISGDLNDLFLNHKEIKNLRQSMVSELYEKRKTSRVEFSEDILISNLNPEEILTKLNFKSVNASPHFNLLLRNKKQVVDLVEAFRANQIAKEEVSLVVLDFEFGRDYKESLDLLKSVGVKNGLATTRILKPQEYNNLKIIHSLNPDVILVRNLGALRYFTEVKVFSGDLKGDFSLNVTNSETFNYLISKNLKSICLSYDLNFEQSIDLLKNIESSRAEITIHQSMPSFHMEHCVFAAFLSKGKSFKDCGKPCEKHKVQLRDQFGNHHWIKPDQECRNTMYNSSAQTALPYLQEWTELNLGEVRFEALDEESTDLIQKIKAYTDYLNGRKNLDQVLDSLKTQEKFGLSPRQLSRSEEYKPIKKDHSFL